MLCRDNGWIRARPPRSQWLTGKAGALKSMGSQRLRHNWVTELRDKSTRLCDYFTPSHRHTHTYIYTVSKEVLTIIFSVVLVILEFNVSFLSFFFGNTGWYLCPLHWKGGVLTTGLPGKSRYFLSGLSLRKLGKFCLFSHRTFIIFTHCYNPTHCSRTSLNIIIKLWLKTRKKNPF